MVRDTKIIALQSALWLASVKTQKKIVLFYCPAADKFVNEYYPIPKAEERHRHGTNWLRSELAYTADRAYRLFIRLFSEQAIFDKPLTVHDFYRYANLYFNTYPSDDMSTNRLHYLIQSIRDGEVVVMGNCKKCNQPFIAHRNDCLSRVCGVCKRTESVKTEMLLAAANVAVIETA